MQQQSLKPRNAQHRDFNADASLETSPGKAAQQQISQLLMSMRRTNSPVTSGRAHEQNEVHTKAEDKPSATMITPQVSKLVEISSHQLQPTPCNTTISIIFILIIVCCSFTYFTLRELRLVQEMNAATSSKKVEPQKALESLVNDIPPVPTITHNLLKRQSPEDEDLVKDSTFVQIINHETLQRMFSENQPKLVPYFTHPKNEDVCAGEELVYKVIKLQSKIDRCDPIRSSLDVSVCCIVAFDGKFMAHICKDDPPLVLNTQLIYGIEKPPKHANISLCLACNIFMRRDTPSLAENKSVNNWWIAIGLSNDYVNTTLTEFYSHGECTIKINAVCTRSYWNYFLSLKLYW